MICWKKALITFLAILAIVTTGALSYKFIFSHKVASRPVQIAIINADRIKQEAHPYQIFEKYFESEKEKIHQEFLQKEKVLREEFSNLKKKKRNKSTPLPQQEKLQEKIKELETQVQNRRDEFSKTIQKNVKVLADYLNLAIEKVAKKHEFNIVLNTEVYEKTLVLYAEKSFDITDAIIEELNKTKIDF